MKITIDNHDGMGAMDYTGAITDSVEWKIVRKLNEPTVCTFAVDCNVARVAMPAKYGRVLVSADAGLLMFSGYIVESPTSAFRGQGIAGPMYSFLVTAVSDEVLLNQQSVPQTQGGVGLLMVDLMRVLTQRVDPVRMTVLADSTANLVGRYAADAARSWSSNAGALAASSRASYRTMNGQLMLQQIGSVTHVLDDSDGTLDVSTLTFAETRQLANDVTVCGESEPQAYVTEVFQGDGTTTTFQLTRTPLHVSTLSGTLINDSFNGAAINPVGWQISDPGSRFTLGAAGLIVNGGNGLDGQTVLSAIDNTEMGGVLVLTAGGVVASAGSDGYIACFYNGSILLANLFAGFHVKQSSGTTVVVPVVNGVEAGASALLAAGRAYSFRLRFHSRDLQRVLDSYYVTVDGGQEGFGGDLIASVADLVFEVQDTTGGINQPTQVLYDGNVTSSPEMCVVAVVNSPAFTGSVQSVSLDQTGTAWVTSLQTGGSPFTRRLGLATIGADCKLASTGKLDFYATSVPLNGELVTVTYRTAGMSVARLFNAASVAAQGTAVVPGVSRWIGSVVQPKARSSRDCENAALALLAVSTSADAGLSGSYTAQNMQQGADVWPGDVLAIGSTALDVDTYVIVRSVTLNTEAVMPEVVTYWMEFANDWAADLSVKTSNVVPKTTWLPQTALAAPTALASLGNLTASVTASQVNVNTGLTAPSGGGFEVRRADWKFGAGSDGTLVMRSSAASFTIPREAAIEQYFVRMYDGSSPRNYSRFSNAICVSVPL